MDDLMGVYERLYARFGPQHWWPADTPFEVAIGAILTQNTNWQNVERAISNLKQDKSLGARKIHNLPTGRLATLIRPAGYYNVKAKRLKAFVEFLSGNYRGSMARMGRAGTGTLRDGLLGVNGIGPETADSILLYALNKPVFVIDAYTRRILRRHGVPEADAPYESFQSYFSRALKVDERLYNEYHALLVRVGKEFCRPRNPNCRQCPLEGVNGLNKLIGGTAV